jgi:hypothetical protein
MSRALFDLDLYLVPAFHWTTGNCAPVRSHLRLAVSHLCLGVPITAVAPSCSVVGECATSGRRLRNLPRPYLDLPTRKSWQCADLAANASSKDSKSRKPPELSTRFWPMSQELISRPVTLAKCFRNLSSSPSIHSTRCAVCARTRSLRQPKQCGRAAAAPARLSG